MRDYQSTLLPYAYNILGSHEDAKDAVQEILMRYHSMDHKHVQNETGYLVKAVIHESLNIKKRIQKTAAPAVWLPEPIATESSSKDIDSAQIISYSILVLLEKLSSKERAVFILKEAFDYTHKEIAKVLDIEEEHSRQLLSRGRKRLGELKTDTVVKSPKIATAYMDDYVESIQTGDIKRLEKLLSDDIVVYADGGGEIQVVREFTKGMRLALKLLLYVFKTYQQKQTIKVTEMNHQPALLFYENGILANCQIFELHKDKIVGMYAQLAPKKLASLAGNLNQTR